MKRFISIILNVTFILTIINGQAADSFKKGEESEMNEQLISVRKVFDQYNLLSALHSYKAQEDPSYKNILPESVIVEHRTVGDDEIVKVEFMIKNENYFYDVNTINCKDIIQVKGILYYIVRMEDLIRIKK